MKAPAIQRCIFSYFLGRGRLAGRFGGMVAYGLRMPELSGGPSCLRNGGNRMFKDQLFLGAAFQEKRKLVKAFDPADQFRDVNKVNCHGSFLAPGQIKKTILDILRCWL